MQIEEGVITEWFVQVGDSVAEGQEIVMVETDKVETALPCPFAGTVVKLFAESGETVPIGGLLAEIEP
jgi:pyruvate/2-oxoglutarate dehydrogenase complex dihydrolipoamide acyltransferase (E2) component